MHSIRPLGRPFLREASRWNRAPRRHVPIHSVPSTSTTHRSHFSTGTALYGHGDRTSGASEHTPSQPGGPCWRGLRECSGCRGKHPVGPACQRPAQWASARGHRLSAAAMAGSARQALRGRAVAGTPSVSKQSQHAQRGESRFRRCVRTRVAACAGPGP